jgi:hypothetical protein
MLGENRAKGDSGWHEIAQVLPFSPWLSLPKEIRQYKSDSNLIFGPINS